VSLDSVLVDIRVLQLSASVLDKPGRSVADIKSDKQGTWNRHNRNKGNSSNRLEEHQNGVSLLPYRRRLSVLGPVDKSLSRFRLIRNEDAAPGSPLTSVAKFGLSLEELSKLRPSDGETSGYGTPINRVPASYHLWIDGSGSDRDSCYRTWYSTEVSSDSYR